MKAWDHPDNVNKAVSSMLKQFKSEKTVETNKKLRLYVWEGVFCDYY